MTKTFDKQFEKAKALVDGGMAVGHACRKAKIKYNTFHMRMKKEKERVEDFQEIVGKEKAPKERIQKVKIEDIYSVIDEIIVALARGEEAQKLFDADVTFSTKDILTILGKVRTKLQRQAYY